MTFREALKYSLETVLRPCVSSASPQRRAFILHEVLPSQQGAYAELLAMLARHPHWDWTVTFDDGYVSSAQAIRKVAPERGIFFVCPEYINRAGSSSWEQFFYQNFLRTESLSHPEVRAAFAPASWQQLRELVKLGYRIGSHSMTHARLSSLTSTKELEREILGSAEVLEDQLQIPVKWFAHPFGDVASISELALRLIRKRYEFFFPGVRGNMHLSRTPGLHWRDTVHFHWGTAHIEFLLSGGLDWRYWKTRRRLARLWRMFEDVRGGTLNNVSEVGPRSNAAL